MGEREGKWEGVPRYDTVPPPILRVGGMKMDTRGVGLMVTVREGQLDAVEEEDMEGESVEAGDWDEDRVEKMEGLEEVEGDNDMV